MEWPPKNLPKDFPLTVGVRGYTKRINGKPKWIAGKVEPAEALRIYHRKAAAILSGSKPLPEPKPMPAGAVVTIHYILAKWLIDRRNDVQAGRIGPSAFKNAKQSAKLIDDVAGHYTTEQWTPDTTRAVHEAIVKKRSANAAAVAMRHFRQAARHAADMEWCKPLRLGERVIATLAARPVPTMKWTLYTPEEIRRILTRSRRRCLVAPPGYLPYRQQLHAMILLALNGGFGGTELSELRKSSVDLVAGRVVHNRGKTDAEHITPLWPETIAALKPVMRQRPDDDMLFRTREGNPWTRMVADYKNGKMVGVKHIDNFGERFRELVTSLRLKIVGEGAYKLKHLACTIADAAGDPHATFVLYGHTLPGAKGHYVKVGEDRLRKVVDYVRHVLLVSPSTGHPQADRTPPPGDPTDAPAASDTPSRRPPERGAA